MNDTQPLRARAVACASSTEETVGAVAKLLGLPAPKVRPLSPRRPDVQWADRVREVAAGASLRVSVTELSVSEAAKSADDHGPLVTAAPGVGWIVVTGSARNRVCVLAGSSLDDERVHDAADVAAALGASPGDRVTWLVLEPALPLDALRSEPGSHFEPHRRLLQLLREERGDLRAVIVYAIAVGALSLSVPIAVQALVNTIAFGSVVQPVVVLTTIVLTALIFDGVLRILQASVVERLQERLFAKAAVDVGERLVRVRADVLRKAYVPELANRFFDVVTVQKAAAALLLDGVGLGLQTGVGLVLLAFYHPYLLAFDVLLVLVIGFILFVLGRGAVETAIKESKSKYAVVAWLEEIGRNTILFRGADTRGFALDRLGAVVGEYLVYRRKHWKILVRQLAAVRVLFAMASAALLGVGGFLVIDRQLTLGQLVAAELIVTSVLAGITKFGKHLESYYDLAAAADKLGQLIDLPMEEEHVRAHGSGLGGVRLEVRGRHELSAAPGARMAIAGPDDAERSIFLDALYGLGAPEGTTVMADGRDLKQVDLESYRSGVALVRSGQVFEGTVLDNVRVGRDHVTDADVQESLVAVGLYDEVLALPDGVFTHLVTGGAPLSEGQVRRLSIARAIAGRPRLLLVDHAVDGVEERLRDGVLDILVDERAPWTLVLATDRADLAARCTAPSPPVPSLDARPREVVS